MKVTALIPNDLVNEVKQYAGGKNLTECLIVALEEWISLKKITKLNKSHRRKNLRSAREDSADRRIQSVKSVKKLQRTKGE